MALLARYGKPDFFVTLTCNPKWPEIAKHTASSAVEDPVLTCQVFKAKLDKLVAHLRGKKSCLGGVPQFSVGVIEFQKITVAFYGQFFYHDCGGVLARNCRAGLVYGWSAS